MTDLLRARLESHTSLGDAERQALAELSARTIPIANRNRKLSDQLAEDHIHVIEEGLVCRYRELADGRRQILALLLPGDVIDLRQFVLGGAPSALSTLSPLTLKAISNVSLFAVLENHSRITRALWSTTLVEEAIAREWLVSIGKRSAIERMAHLLCEIYMRLRAVGRTNGNQFALPLTQSELADALGLSTVHVNRTLQELRKSGLIAFQTGMVEVFDFEALAELALFSPGYLHLR